MHELMMTCPKTNAETSTGIFLKDGGTFTGNHNSTWCNHCDDYHEWSTKDAFLRAVPEEG